MPGGRRFKERPSGSAAPTSRLSGVTVSNLLDRLVQNARAHLHEWLQRQGITEPAPTWRDDPPGDPVHVHEPRAASSPLPHSAELEDAFRILDLPFGATLPEADERWKSYLKRCHPDRFHNDPKRQSDAAELSRQLNAAHDRIEAAWRQAGTGGTG